MKKTLFALIALMAIATGAKAAESLKIGGKSVDLSVSSTIDSPEGNPVHYDASTKTLTISSGYHSFGSNRAIESSVKGLTIVVEDESSISSNDDCLYFTDASTTITGTGKLKVFSEKSAIILREGSGLTIDGGVRVETYGNKYGLNGDGLDSGSAVVVKGGYLILYNSAKGTAIHALGLLQVKYQSEVQMMGRSGATTVDNLRSLDLWAPVKIFSPAGASFDKSKYTFVDENGKTIKGNIQLTATMYIDATNFPDKNFRNYLLDQYYGQDGVLTYSERIGVQTINITEHPELESLKGMEYFPSLKNLNVSRTKLTGLDLSPFPLLEEFVCISTSLKTLDVSKNTKLKHLNCANVPLKTLNVRNNKELTFLNCQNTSLTTIDVTQNTKLQSLDCSCNSLEELDVSKNKNLKELWCYRNRITLEAMDKLTKYYLAYRSENDGIIFACSKNDKERNFCTSTHATMAKDRGWRLYFDDGEKYSGTDYFVEINEKNFPDANFRTWLKQQSYGEDGKITYDELEKVRTINVYKNEISSLKGIEFFSALVDLQCARNNITTLDVSHFPSLCYIQCEQNNISTLDVSKNPNMIGLWCRMNQIKALDLSCNARLRYLSCPVSIESLNLKNCTALEDLTAEYASGLKTLDLTDCTSLKELDIMFCSVESLDLSKCRKLKDLACMGNEFTTLDVSGLTELERIQCYNGKLTTLKVSGCKALKDLDCSENQLTALDVSGCTSLVKLCCNMNNISYSRMDALIASLPKYEGNDTLRFEVFSSLHTYYHDHQPFEYKFEGNVCTKAQVQAAKARGWIAFRGSYSYWEVYEGSDPINIAIDEENFPDDNFRRIVGGSQIDKDQDGYLSGEELSEKTVLSVEDEGIKSLKGIGYFFNLTFLDCSLNELTRIYVNNNLKLKTLYCNGNNLTELIVSDLLGLEWLDCDDNNIEQLDVWRLPKLKLLYCSGNNITELDVTKNQTLTVLYCDNMGLTSLDVSKNEALKDLNCSYNKIAKLDVSNNKELTRLFCSFNRLSELDLSNNADLAKVYCEGNRISGTNMDKLINSLPPKGGNLYLCSEGAIPDNFITTSQAAKAKSNKWEVWRHNGKKWETYEGSDRKPGDVNGDGAVNVADIGAVIDIMAGSADVSSASADVNGDGAVNVADIAAIIDIMAANARRLNIED